MSDHLTDENRAHIAQLCPELRAILDAELAAGNSVAETWTNWGHVILLGRPFRQPHSLEGTRVVYEDIDDPHYWKAQYSEKALKQVVACRFPS